MMADAYARLDVMLSGETTVFPVIGDPIGQVRSPHFLTEILVRRGQNAIVVPISVKPNDVHEIIDSFARMANVAGALVTIPHKSSVVLQCAKLTQRADFVRAVNVIRKGPGDWFGDNTDGQGYAQGLAQRGFAIAGRSALLVGAGGAGAAIALELLERGAAALAIHDVDTARREGLADRLAARYPGRVRTGGSDPAGYDLVANATPMGMRPGDPLPVDVSRLQAWQFVACVVTRPEISPLIAEARARGCRTMTGVQMFDAQAELLADFLLARTLPDSPEGSVSSL